MNTVLPTYIASAAWLRESGFAPAPIAPGHSAPAGPWAASQLSYEGRAQPDELAAVFTGLPPPRGPGGVDNFKATHLVTLTLDVRDNVRAELESIIARHVGDAKCPVRVSHNGERVYLFAAAANAQFTEKRAHLEYSTVKLGYFPECVALAADGAGRPYEWPAGDLFSVRRSELASLDNAAMDALMSDVGELFSKHAPPPPKRTARVPKPIVAPGDRVTWNNDRALKTLRDNGYEVVPVRFGRSAPDSDAWRQNMVSWRFDNSKGGANAYGVGVISTVQGAHQVAALELWSRSAQSAADLEKLGFAVRTESILAAITAIIMKHVDGEKVAIRRDSTGRTLFLFRHAAAYNSADFERLLTANTPGTAVKLKLTAREGCFVYSGNDAAGVPFVWENDLLSTKREDLAEFSSSAMARMRAEVEAFMDAGGGLSEKTPDTTSTPKRTRKAG